MIRGTTAQFKFEMPTNIGDFCTIEVIFGQEGNVGTVEAPLPIKKVYHRGYIRVKTWSPVAKNQNNIYYDGQTYYRFEYDTWVSYSSLETYALNHGTQIDPTNPKILLVSLTPSETMRFSDKRKGIVQILGYCDTDGIVIGSYSEKFMIHPVHTDDISGLLPTDPSLIIMDSGTIL